MHFKLKVNCTTPISKLKLSFKNKSFDIPKVYQNLGKIPKLKFLYQSNTSINNMD